MNYIQRRMSCFFFNSSFPRAGIKIVLNDDCDIARCTVNTFCIDCFYDCFVIILVCVQTSSLYSLSLKPDNSTTILFPLLFTLEKKYCFIKLSLFFDDPKHRHTPLLFAVILLLNDRTAKMLLYGDVLLVDF